MNDHYKMNNHYNKKKVVYLLLITILLLGCCGCQMKKKAVKYTNTGFAMGTTITELIYADSEEIGADVGAEVIKLLSKIENQEISWRVGGSWIYKINDTKEAVESDEKVVGWLQKSLEIYEASDGALNPGIGALARLWDIGGDNPKVPTKQELTEALQKINTNTINIEETGIVQTDPEKVLVDLGAVGKGIGADEAMAYLEDQEAVSGAIISVGGSLCIYGEKPDGSEWSVGVQDPRQADGCMLGLLDVPGGTCISTSGDYEKYFEENGKRYHHILDGSTGYPSKSGLISVTVICDSGLVSDGLSTACFVLGLEKGLPLLEKYGAEAVFVDKAKNVYVTEGAKFTLDNTDDYQIKELKLN